ncbi:MAG TPA: cyclic nucleotide-binding domain-containing protein [Burkholderiales bacterium]
MNSAAQLMQRPRRWDAPFDASMSDALVAELLARPEFASIDASRFPSAAPLHGILKNDCRIRTYRPGDIVVRDGDYGNSAYIVLSGVARVVLPPGLPDHVLGRSAVRKRGLFDALGDLLRRPAFPEVRETAHYETNAGRPGAAVEGHSSLLDVRDPEELFGKGVKPGARPERLPPLAAAFKTAVLSPGTLFGEIAALGRVQRTATVFAEGECRILEMRWQALRDIKNRDEGWRQRIEQGYRENQLRIHLVEHPMLAGLDATVLQKIADRTLFETYGSYEWYVEYKIGRADEGGRAVMEPPVAMQGDYPDGLLLVIGGFGRVSSGLGHGARTLTYLRNGDHFGLDELLEAWKGGHDCPYETSLTALGYLHVLRIPFDVLAELVFPRVAPPAGRIVDAAARPIAQDAFLEWAVDERYINGTRTMLIDLEKCVRCDDCVRACSDTHGGNPRFVRHGNTFGSWMVANACMHCVDPVCMIGCPTGAIHRSTAGGSVVINDLTCIGCGTCANSCPYDNIRLVPIRERDGRAVLDPASHEPILKATKCDLCHELPSGPSCERACAHGALRRVDIQSLIAHVGALSH